MWKFRLSSFSTTRGHVLDGRKLAAQLRSQMKAEIAVMKQKFPAFQPRLAIVQVGNRPDSEVYIKAKINAGAEIGIEVRHVRLPADAPQGEVSKTISELNNDPDLHGVILQLPVGAHLSADALTDLISPLKDVDGLSSLNQGLLRRNATAPHYLPCTPKGVIKLLELSGHKLDGAKAVVIGRSQIVGKPVAELLTHRNCTVTICHSRTSNAELKAHLAKADIVVAAIGKPRFVRGEWLKPGCVVVDVGINAEGKQLVGDVDYASAKETASHITPVPGGVGPLTVAGLLENTLLSAKKQAEIVHEKQWPLLRDLKTGVISSSPDSPVPSSSGSSSRPPAHSVPSDTEIVEKHRPIPIMEIGAAIGLSPSELLPYGEYKAKVRMEVLDRLAKQQRKAGRYVCVAGITPTPLGEGKSTLVIGLAQALGAHAGKNSLACIRQPSQGPTFGIKGGAAGGGYSQVVPMDEFNLHLTGDIHAISAAHNLMAAAIDARRFHEAKQADSALWKRIFPKATSTFSKSMLARLATLNILKKDPSSLTEEERTKFVRLDIDPEAIQWNRVLDINDRFLRGISVGEGPEEKGFERKTGFSIAVASEIMAIMALSKDYEDMESRLGRMVFGWSKQGQPLTANDLSITGALMVLLKDALLPNLMQTLEGTPVFVHCGPFANIAHGNSSVVADLIGLRLVGEDGYVVTEAGFGADIGLEKFANIKCRASGLQPSAFVVVATVRALKMHGGGPPVTAGVPLATEYTQENVELVEKGCANLDKQIENAAAFGVPVLVAINQFDTDSEKEVEVVRRRAAAAGAKAAVVCTHHSNGGKGALELAKALIDVCEKNPPNFDFLYDVKASPLEKMNIIAKRMYGADAVTLSPRAEADIKLLTEKGYGELPMCMAKTHLSLSAQPALKGRPTGFTLPVREVRLAAGAGFLYPLVGTMSTMPGLPTRPAFMDVNLDYSVSPAKVKGLF